MKDDKMVDGGTLRVSKNFKEMIIKLKEMEYVRGNRKCSDSTATEIMYQRIIDKGGLKE